MTRVESKGTHDTGKSKEQIGTHVWCKYNQLDVAGAIGIGRHNFVGPSHVWLLESVSVGHVGYLLFHVGCVGEFVLT